MADFGKTLTSEWSLGQRWLAAITNLLSGPAEPSSSREELSERDLRRINAAQIASVTRQTPATMAVNVVNAVIVVTTFWNSGSNIFLVCWLVAVVLVALLAVGAWVRKRRNPPKEASIRGLRRMTLQAFMLALVWGLAPIVLFPSAPPTYQLVIACLMTGMMSGGAFALSTAPHAGLAYTWTMASASAIALFLCNGDAYTITAVFLLLYAIFLSRNLVTHGTLFMDNLRSKLELERKTEIISLLLKDFQANASDWLWQTDVDGRLVSIPERFVEASQLPLALLRGAAIADVLAMLSPDDRAAVASVTALMAKREPLHDVAVHVVVAGKPRLWSMTAKPVLDH